MKTNPAVSSIAIAVESSHNAKTGKVSATYVAQQSCPSTCSFKRNGCYAEQGSAAFTTRRLNRASDQIIAEGIDLSPEIIATHEAEAIRALTGKLPLRVHVVGDAITDRAASIVADAMLEHSAKRGQFAWTYTHAWRDVQVSSWHGVSVLASCETASDVREATARGYATCIVVDEHPSNKRYERDGVSILPCPQEQGNGLTCADCGLCSRADVLKARGLTVGFAAHSAKAEAVKQALYVRREREQSKGNAA